MDIKKTAQKIVNNLQKVVDDATALSYVHSRPHVARQLNYFAQRAAMLRREIEEVYYL